MTTQEKIIHYRERTVKELEAQVRALKRQGKVLSAERDQAYFTMDELIEGWERAIVKSLRLERELELKDRDYLRCLEFRSKLLGKLKESRNKNPSQRKG